ncbi:MAG: hypothetical protein JSC188_000748 [Candidatus Tokpelaia sp. JSC188]|nr:MAG: hypothetical protein JSC188_000748 [Candidatus Tokpelaia sp. JSC188]
MSFAFLFHCYSQRLYLTRQKNECKPGGFMKETHSDKTKKITSDIDLIKLCSCQTEEKFKEIVSFIRHSVNAEKSKLLDDPREKQVQKVEEILPE